MKGENDKLINIYIKLHSRRHAYLDIGGDLIDDGNIVSKSIQDAKILKFVVLHNIHPSWEIKIKELLKKRLGAGDLLNLYNVFNNDTWFFRLRDILYLPFSSHRDLDPDCKYEDREEWDLSESIYGKQKNHEVNKMDDELREERDEKRVKKELDEYSKRQLEQKLKS